MGIIKGCMRAVNTRACTSARLRQVSHAAADNETYAEYASCSRQVGLDGFAKFFASQSEEERGHAEQFMQYQNIRGGKVLLRLVHSGIWP